MQIHFCKVAFFNETRIKTCVETLCILKTFFWLLSVLHGPSFFHPSTLPLGYRGGGPWLGIEPGTSRTRSQHYTTRLSRRRYSVYVLGLKHTCYLLVTRWDEILADLAMFLYNQWRDIIIKQELVFLRVNTTYFFIFLIQ